MYVKITVIIIVLFHEHLLMASKKYAENCTNSLCQYCELHNYSLCKKCKNISICHNDVSNQSTMYLQCVEDCPANTFYEHQDEERMCCQKCHEACIDGCTGESPYAEAYGCNKCKYFVKEQKNNKTRYRCLKPYDKDVCIQNFYHNYFLTNSSDSAKGKYECRACHENCLSCTEFGNDVHQHGCTCNSQNVIFEQKDGQTRKLCNGTHILSGLGIFPTISDNTNTTILTPVKYILGILLIIVAILIFIYFRKMRIKKKLSKEELTSDKRIINQRLLSNPKSGQKPNFLQNGQNESLMPFSRNDLEFADSISNVMNCTNINMTVEPAWENPRGPFASTSTSGRLKTIPEDDLITGDKIGEGAFGEVYKGIWKNQGEAIPVAIKNLKESALRDAFYETKTMATIQKFVDDQEAMANQQHPYILRFIGINMTKGIKIISALMDCNLVDYFNRNKDNLHDFNEIRLLNYCTQIASAMEFLHKHNIVHADLAARNVLVRDEDHVEVSDFGLSRNMRGRKIILDRIRCPWRWISLESLKSTIETEESIVDKPNDVWEFGITCWEIMNFCQKRPYVDEIGIFGDCNMLLQYLIAGSRLQQPDCSFDAWTLLLRCWTMPPLHRLTFENLKIEFEQLLSKLKYETI